MPEEFVEFSEASEAKIGFDRFAELIKVDVVVGCLHVQFNNLPVNYMRQSLLFHSQHSHDRWCTRHCLLQQAAGRQYRDQNPQCQAHSVIFL